MKRKECVGKIIQDEQTSGTDWVYIHNGEFESVREDFNRHKRAFVKLGLTLWHSGPTYCGENTVTKIWGESDKNEWGEVSL